MKYVIGIDTEVAIRERTLAIARGDTFKKDEPKVWFNSLSRCSEIFDSESIKLIKIIRHHQPTIKELSMLTNLSILYLTAVLEALFLHDIIFYGVDGKIITLYDEIQVRIEL